MTYDHVAGRLSPLDRVVVGAVPPGGNWRNLPEEFPSKRIEQIRRGAATGNGSRSTYYGRLRWDRPSYTISTFFSRPGNGCFIHPSASRLITIREAARLQTFPDHFRFTGKGRARFIQVGNAVPPLLAYQLGALLGAGSAVDLFCGAGGMSLGLELAGFKVEAAVDNDASAISTFETNHPKGDSAILADLSDGNEHLVVMKEIERRVGDNGVDLLAGGPPCQGFSTAGNCRLDDPRNKLVFAFLQAVERLRPRALLMENVAALMFRRGEDVLAQIRQTLHGFGYNTSVVIAHAEGYGVPQLRRRLFLLGTFGVPAWPAPWRQVIDPSHMRFQPGGVASSRCPEPFNVMDAIGDLPVEEACSADTAIAYATPPQSALQRWARGTFELSKFVPPSVVVEDPATLFRENRP